MGRTRSPRTIFQASAQRIAPECFEADNAARIASIIQWSDDAIIGKSLDGTITSWNRGAERTYGFTAQEAIGRPIGIILPSNRSDEMQTVVERLRAGERIEHYETERQHKDGRILDVALTVSPIMSESGAMVGVSSISRDIGGARQASHYVRSLIEASLDPLVTISSEGKITDVNEATIRVTGVPRQKLVGTDFSNYFTEPEKAREGYKEVFAKGSVTDYPLTIRHKEGRLTDVLYNASVYKDIRGAVLGVFAAARDVTASKRAEQKFQALIEAAPDAMIMVNRLGTIMLINGQTERSFGYSRNELLGKSIEQLVPERFHGLHRGHRIAFFEKPMPRPMGAGLDLWGRRKDGTEFPIELSLSPIETDEGTHVTATIRDITIQKQASHYVRSLIEASLDPLVTISSEGKITDVNEATIRVTGVPRQKLVGTDFSNYFTEPEKAREGYKEVFAKGSVTDYPLTIRHKEGRLTDVLYNASVYKDIRGAVLGVFAAARDVTVQRRTEAELVSARETALQASRAKSAFLATMSHEIRPPMNGVVGMIEILARSSLSDHQAELIQTVRKSADTLLRIIDDILDFSKIEAGKLDLDLRPVSVVDIATGVCMSLGSMASVKGVNLERFIDPRIPPWVLADDVRLRQILYNLAGNAIKFSGGRQDRAGEVSVRAEIDSEYPLRLRFRIADNGIGMSPETVSNLFASFSQAEVSTTRRFGGTGLGLAISKRLVDLMGGSIEVLSTLGKGSVFTVTLPFDVASEPPRNSLQDFRGIPKQSITQARAAGRSVLVAEDDPVNQKVIRQQLELLGYAVEVASNGEEALRLWRGGSYGLLLTDLHMPEMDGYTLTRAIRNGEPALQRAPILALTANALRGEGNRARDAGMDDYLVKPITLDRLKAALEKWFPDATRAEAYAPFGAGQDLADREAAIKPEEAVDVSTLEALVGTDATTIRGLLSDYLASTTCQVQQVLEAQDSGDLDVVSMTCHKLKSSSRAVGAARLGSTCEDLEAAGSAKDQEAARRLIPELQRGLSEVERFIARFLER